jgi:hypothetical protein
MCPAKTHGEHSSLDVLRASRKLSFVRRISTDKRYDPIGSAKRYCIRGGSFHMIAQSEIGSCALTEPRCPWAGWVSRPPSPASVAGNENAPHRAGTRGHSATEGSGAHAAAKITPSGRAPASRTGSHAGNSTHGRLLDRRQRVCQDPSPAARFESYTPQARRYARRIVTEVAEHARMNGIIGSSQPHEAD